MVVLYDQNCFISLGPHCMCSVDIDMCFLPTFLIIFGVSIFMIRLVFLNSDNLYFKLCTLFICGGTSLAYLAVALSDPGIVTEQNSLGIEQEQLRENVERVRKRVCKKCGFRVKPKTYHCRSCDVCIEGYDHHCPWTSKCIGKGNIVQFYIFVLMMPVFMVYIFISFGTIMSKQQAHVHHL